MKLGEELVRRGMITKEHLRLALERQVVFGGRIGTNIVELGILREEEFSAFLSDYLRVSHVEPNDLAAVEEETIACIGKGLAEKYKAIPFRKEKNRLHVAMMDPTKMRALDELRFMTGYDVIPYAALELRLLFALEKYYGVKRDLRFISILDKEAEEKGTDEEGEDYKESLKKVKEAFSVVSNREEVAGLVISEAVKVAKRTSLFLVRGSEVTGWTSKGMSVKGFKTQADPPSLLHDVIMRKIYYRGPVLQIPGNEEFIGLLGGTPQDSLVVPINIRDRVIAILYADNGVGMVLDSNLTYINTICQLATLSFELLIVKNKIMEL